MFVWHLLASTGVGRGQRRARGSPAIARGISRHSSMSLLLLLQLLLLLFVLLLPVSLPLLLSELFLVKRLASM